MVDIAEKAQRRSHALIANEDYPSFKNLEKAYNHLTSATSKASDCLGHVKYQDIPESSRYHKSKILLDAWNEWEEKARKVQNKIGNPAKNPDEQRKYNLLAFYIENTHSHIYTHNLRQLGH